MNEVDRRPIAKFARLFALSNREFFFLHTEKRYKNGHIVSQLQRSMTEVSIDSRAGLSACCTIAFKRDARGKKAPFVATFTIFLKTKVK